MRILPWDPWLPRCSKNLARSCQDSQDASKRVNPGFFCNKSRFISPVRVAVQFESMPPYSSPCSIFEDAQKLRQMNGILATLKTPDESFLSAFVILDRMLFIFPCWLHSSLFASLVSWYGSHWLWTACNLKECDWLKF